LTPGGKHAITAAMNDGHRPAQAPRDFGRAFALGTLLNLAFVAIEVAAGWYAESIALLADAGHNLSDVLALVLAWGATALARRPPSARYTYGLRSTTILAAVANASLILVVAGGIAWEAIRRIAEPAPVNSAVVIAVAAAGVAVNAATAALFRAGLRGDVNVRGAFWHMAADALVSLGVVAAGIAMLAGGWTWLDPAIGLVVVAVIVYGTRDLLAEALELALHAVPRSVDPGAVRDFLEAQPGVAGVHDLHIWGMSTTDAALSAHLVIPGGHPGDAYIAEVARGLERRFGNGHATLQIELGEPGCALACEEEDPPRR
jgi:cobalt-zinc-cadmium efflux system protein